MKLPRHHALFVCSLLTCASALSHAQQDPSTPSYDLSAQEDWYRVEVLIFAREDEAAFAAENWDPLPTLAYPQHYRFLLDPTLADQRLSETAALSSEFDPLGVQQLSLPRLPVGVDPIPRPDAVLQPPEPELDPTEEALPALIAENDPAAASSGDSGNGALSENNALEIINETAAIDPETPLIALPFMLLDRETLEFRAQARQLQRQGRRVLFHEAWWLPLPEGDDAKVVALDRGADFDMGDWPGMQGSIGLYRTRYLHVDLNLWLNSAGTYLPREWSMPNPPLPRPSVRALRQDGSDETLPREPLSIDDLLPVEEPAPVGAIGTEPFPGFGDDGQEFIAVSEPEAEPEDMVEIPDPYTYRHAIVHQQSRRMRSGELHYLDHPVLAVVLRLTPVSADNLPLVGAERAEWRERHGFPVEHARTLDYAEDAARE